MTNDPSGLRTAAAYDAVRAAARAELEERKAARRVQLGDRLCLVFEDAATVRGALEETLHADRVTDPVTAAAEARAFAALEPPPGGLAAVLFVDADEPGALADTAEALLGVEHAVFIEAEGRRIRATPADGTDPAAGAALVTFHLAEDDRAAVRSASEVAVGVDHPRLQVRAVLEDRQRQALFAGF